MKKISKLYSNENNNITWIFLENFEYSHPSLDIEEIFIDYLILYGIAINPFEYYRITLYWKETFYPISNKNFL